LNVNDLDTERLRDLRRSLGIGLKMGRLRMTTSHTAFTEAVVADEKGRPIRSASIHRIWDAHFEACRAAGLYCAIVAPFGHGKTVRNIVSRASYEIGRDVNQRIKLVSSVDNNAKHRVMAVSSILKKAAYRRLYPHVREMTAKEARTSGAPKEWTQHSIYLKRPGFSIDPTLQAFGVLGSGVGARCDGYFFDDVVDFRNTLEKPALREKVIDAIDNVWLSRLEPWGWVMYVGTPWHESDATHWILKQKGWSILWQNIKSDFSCIEQKVYNPPPNYPIPAYSRVVGDSIKSERWV
jgi:hypothetical protein